jgi:hypothetical protein
MEFLTKVFLFGEDIRNENKNTEGKDIANTNRKVKSTIKELKYQYKYESFICCLFLGLGHIMRSLPLTEFFNSFQKKF